MNIFCKKISIIPHNENVLSLYDILQIYKKKQKKAGVKYSLRCFNLYNRSIVMRQPDYYLYRDYLALTIIFTLSEGR